MTTLSGVGLVVLVALIGLALVVLVLAFCAARPPVEPHRSEIKHRLGNLK